MKIQTSKQRIYHVCSLLASRSHLHLAIRAGDEEQDPGADQLRVETGEPGPQQEQDSLPPASSGGLQVFPGDSSTFTSSTEQIVLTSYSSP